MISRFSLLLALTAAAAVAADDPALPSSAKDMLRARLAQEAPAPAAKSAAPAAGKSAPPAQPTPATPPPPAVLAPGATPDLNASPTTSTATTGSNGQKSKNEPATVLPKVEVRKPRITVLDQELAKQDEAIAREKKNTKPTEMDKALNDSKVSKALSIFGGESSDYRKQVSSERVSLMEDEKDLIEAIAHAKTKEEKAGLKKQLDELRAERRELEKAMR